MSSLQNRREFLRSTGAALGAAALSLGRGAPALAAGHALGIDTFAVRAMGWKAPQLIDYAASLGCTSLFITDFDALESHGDEYLQRIRAQADAKGVRIQLGTWSIDPTSKAFRPNWGTAENHLALGIRMARALGSPVLRVVLGTWEDRLSDGGIERHIESVIAVCRSQRARAMDAGIRIAVENHAGDMHSTELAGLVEAAGKDYVGVNLDSGNALWTLEDPLDSLRTLAPYVATTSLRDSAVWETETGAAVAWTAMGEGQIDLKTWFGEFRRLCPGVPVHIETISGFSREFPYLTAEFWKAWPKMPAAGFARFLALAKAGTPRAPFQPPDGPDRLRAEQEYQRGELERSITYCREAIGIGSDRV
jgi:sugar phosphate isomerase/epimerase